MTAIEVPGVNDTPTMGPTLHLVSGGAAAAHSSATTGVLGSNDGLLAATSRQLRLKRLMDLVVAALALLVFLPLLVVIALAVALTSTGPVLYRQTRIGKGGEPFDFVKFRTMRVGSDAARDDLADQNEASGPVFKIKHDPRITAVGRILRKLSLDEMPQLAHVLTGSMSLVGPRPPLPDEVTHYTARERQRLLVKPGLTCIWQVSGRSDIGFDRWVDMDLGYIKHWSPMLDLRILAATLPAVLSGRGAY